jgi:hypothetical protein
MKVCCSWSGSRKVQPHVPDADASGLDDPSIYFPKTDSNYDQSPRLNNRLDSQVQRIHLPPFTTQQANIMPSELAACRAVLDSG